MRTLVTLVFCFIFLCVGIGDTFGQQIRLAEKISIDRSAELQSEPESFCVTEDGLFVILEKNKNALKICVRDGNSLKFVTTSNRIGLGNTDFIQPRHCIYSKYSTNECNAQLGISDYGYEKDESTKKMFLFSRSFSKSEFEYVKEFKCPRAAYDMEFNRDGKELIVSGNIEDSSHNSYALYSINIEKGNITYLLTSIELFGLKNIDEYNKEYREKQTIPAAGIKAFFDIFDEDVVMVLESSLRIIKFNLRSQKVEQTFGKKTAFYKQPDGVELAKTYIKGKFQETWENRGKYSYITNIFATEKFIFLVYETSKNGTFRLQTYTHDGVFRGDVSIPVEEGQQMSQQMWYDKQTDDLYAFVYNDGKLEVFKYEIIEK